MEIRIKVVFELSKFANIWYGNTPIWLEFITNFIVQANNRCDFYFLLNTTDIKNMENYVSSLKNEQKTILDMLTAKKVNITDYEIKFGLFNDISKMDDKQSVLFYDIDNQNNVIELNNKDSFFFFSNYDIGEVLHYSDFFIYLLDFENLNNEPKKRKKLIKLSNGFVDKDNFNKINYEQISYEFLTFLEGKNQL